LFPPQIYDQHIKNTFTGFAVNDFVILLGGFLDLAVLFFSVFNIYNGSVLWFIL